jgi:hypothetical protein
MKKPRLPVMNIAISVRTVYNSWSPRVAKQETLLLPQTSGAPAEIRSPAEAAKIKMIRFLAYPV